MKRWSIFGAARAPEAKQDAPPTPPLGGFEWSGMFNVRRKLGDRRARRARTDAEEPTSV